MSSQNMAGTRTRKVHPAVVRPEMQAVRPALSPNKVPSGAAQKPVQKIQPPMKGPAMQTVRVVLPPVQKALSNVKQAAVPLATVRPASSPGSRSPKQFIKPNVNVGQRSVQPMRPVVLAGETQTSASQKPLLKKRSRENVVKLNRLAFQAAMLKSSTPTKASLKLSLVQTADGSPIYFESNQHHILSWAEAMDKAGGLRVIAGRCQQAGRQNGLPIVFEYDQTFSEANEAYLRVSASVFWRSKTIGIGIASMQGAQSRNWVAMTLSPRSDGVHIAGKSSVEGKLRKSAMVAPSGLGAGHASRFTALVEALAAKGAFTQEFSRAAYFMKFIDHGGSSSRDKSAVATRLVGGGGSNPADPNLGQGASGVTFAGPINATTADNLKGVFSVEMGLLQATAAFGGSILAGPPGAFVATIVASSVANYAKQEFNGFVDLTVASQSQAAQLAQDYASDANNYTTQADDYANQAEEAAESGDAIAAQSYATLAQQYADLALQNATQAVNEAAASGNGATAASQAALSAAQSALTSASAVLTEAQQAQSSATNAQAAAAPDESLATQDQEQEAEAADQTEEEEDQEELEEDEEQLDSVFDEGN
jgi:hypothetical protein